MMYKKLTGIAVAALTAVGLMMPSMASATVCEDQEPPFTCPEGKVPGWLDEDGNPTSCVDDNPTPNVPKEDEGEQVIPPAPEIHIPDTISAEHVTPAEIPEVVKVSAKPNELAVTGASDSQGALVISALGVMGLGASALLLSRRHRRLSDVK